MGVVKRALRRAQISATSPEQSAPAFGAGFLARLGAIWIHRRSIPRRVRVLILLSANLAALLALAVVCALTEQRVEVDGPYSYYVPGVGTVGIKFGPPSEPPRLTGEVEHDLVIASDQGTNVTRIDRDGSVRWRYVSYPETARAVFAAESSVGFVQGSKVVFLDQDTGAPVKELNPLHQQLAFARPHETSYLIGRWAEGRGGIVLWDEHRGVLWENPYPTAFARAADKRGDVVVIADTFGHRVYGVDIRTNQITFEVEEYYPGDVSFLSDSMIMIVGEHTNRIWQLDLVSGTRTWLVGCDRDLFRDLFISVEKFSSVENQRGLLITPSSPDISRSVCAARSPLELTLYSVNSARLDDQGGMIIADTDNHRVLSVSDRGEVLAAVTELNNPQSAVFLR